MTVLEAYRVIEQAMGSDVSHRLSLAALLVKTARMMPADVDAKVQEAEEALDNAIKAAARWERDEEIDAADKRERGV